MNSRPSVPAVLTACLGACLALALSCGPKPRITITTPAHGEFIDAGTVVVEGTTNVYSPSFVVRVNGTVVTLDPSKTWSHVVALDTVDGMTPIDAELEKPSGQIVKDRITVIAGPSIVDGSPSPKGVGLRFNESALLSLSPFIESLAGGAFDVGALVLGLDPLIDVDNIFLTFDVVASAYEADTNGYSIDVDVQAGGHTDVDITIDDLHLGIDMNVSDGLAIDWDCKMELDVDSALISGSYDMVPDAGDPSFVDVNQLGDPTVVLNGVSYLFISGPCDPDAPLIGDLINAALAAGASIETLMADGFRDNLKDPDGAGPLDSPVAEGIETGLAGVSIAGEVSAAVGVNLAAPFDSIAEDDDGLSMGADAAFTSVVGTGPGECDPPPAAPSFAESYDIPVTAPGLGTTTPLGAPFELGLSISASAFNQLLKSTVECGLLTLDISVVEFGGSPVTLTTDLFNLFGMPEFEQVIGPGVPLTIRLEPTIAPYVTANAGPSGEAAAFVLPFLVMSVIEPGAPGGEKEWLSAAIDTKMGFDLAYDPVAAALTPTITAPLTGDTLARLLTNDVGATPFLVELVVPNLFNTFLSAFADLFGAFPLPTFLGLQLEVVEIDRDFTSGFFNLYTNLDVVPQTRIENAVFIDDSPNDSVTDGVFDVNEWRHRSKITATPTSIAAQLQGVLAADACCTLDDEERTESPGYRLQFDVVPENGESWQLDIDHAFLGALTLVDEANAIYDGAESVELQTPIMGRYRIDGGAWTSFDFGLFPQSSVSDGFGGAENDHSVEVSGTNGVTVCGSAPASVEVEFEFTAKVRSNSNVAFPAIDGGEAALRFGVHDTIELGTAPSAGFTAGNYPGLGGREISTDGHFATVALTPLPGGCP